MTEFISDLNEKKIVVSGGYLGTMIKVPILNINGPVHVFNIKIKRQLPEQYRDIYRYVLYAGTRDDYRVKKKTLDASDLNDIFHQFMYTSLLGKKSYADFCRDLKLDDGDEAADLWGCFKRMYEKAQDLGISDDDLLVTLPKVKPNMKLQPQIFIKGGW